LPLLAPKELDVLYLVGCSLFDLVELPFVVIALTSPQELDVLYVVGRRLKIELPFAFPLVSLLAPMLF
jgi:hypothetical protein